MDVFEQAFAIVIGNESGFSITAIDPGNWTGGRVGAGELRGTKFGVSASAYPDVDIASLTLAEARIIYRRDYWSELAGDRLPSPIAVLLFDAAVNSGVDRAAKWLQQAVGTAVDGDIGPETLDAVDKAIAKLGQPALCAEVVALRLMFMTSLPTWRSFGLGWARRICRLPYSAMSVQSQGSVG